MASTITYNDLNNNGKKPQGSGFTNLQSFLDANQGNNLSGTLSAGINKNVQNANNSLQTSQNSFQNQSSAEQQRLNQENQGVQNTFGQIDNLNAVPTSGTKPLDQSQVDNYNSFLGDQYKGPTTLENSGLLQNQAQSLGTLGNSVNSRAGRVDLLNQFAGQGNGNYSLNDRNLDEMFLGTGGGNQTLLDARRNALGSMSNIQGALSNSSNTAQGIESNLTNEQADARNGITSRSSAIDDAATNQFGQLQQDQATQLSDFKNNVAHSGRVGGDFLNPDYYSLMGINRGAHVYNQNMTDVANLASAQQLNQQDALSTQQRAQLLALGQLSGQDPNSLFKINGNAYQFDPNGVQKTNTANDLLNFNKGQLSSDLADQAAQYQKALGTFGNQMYMGTPTITLPPGDNLAPLKLGGKYSDLISGLNDGSLLKQVLGVKSGPNGAENYAQQSQDLKNFEKLYSTFQNQNGYDNTL